VNWSHTLEGADPKTTEFFDFDEDGRDLWVLLCLFFEVAESFLVFLDFLELCVTTCSLVELSPPRLGGFLITPEEVASPTGGAVMAGDDPASALEAFGLVERLAARLASARHSEADCHSIWMSGLSTILTSTEPN